MKNADKKEMEAYDPLTNKWGAVTKAEFLDDPTKSWIEFKIRPYFIAGPAEAFLTRQARNPIN